MKSFYFAFLLAAFFVSCTQPIEMLGVGETVTEKENSESTSNPSDDTLEKKQPLSYIDHTVIESFNGCEVRLNKTTTITALDIGKLTGDAEKFEKTVFHDRGNVLKAIDNLHDTIEIIPSLETVNGTMKPFNDGLYA